MTASMPSRGATCAARSPPAADPAMAHRMRALVFLSALVTAPPAFAKPLFETQSKYSHIVVTENNGIRHLMFDKVTQSSGRPDEPRYLHHAYTQAMMAGLALTTPNRVLVIGLGGGSMPMFIHAHFPNAIIDVVEIDPTVLEVATRYFGYREDDHLKTFIEDGAAFVERVQQQYDLVLLDAYAPDFIPPQLASVSFFMTLKEKMKKDGVLASNVWGPPNPAYASMLQTQQRVFSHVAVVRARASGNHVFFARDKRIERGTFSAACRKLQNEKSFAFDLAENTDRGFLMQ
jgi:spermidine synthase